MEKKQEIITALGTQDLFEVYDVTNINHNPHPYMIGPKHVSHSQQYGGVLDNRTLKEVQCSSQGCNLSYEEHTSDEVCFLKLKRDGTNEEANAILKELVDDLGENFIDGFSFIETEEEFRIN